MKNAGRLSEIGRRAARDRTADRVQPLPVWAAGRLEMGTDVGGNLWRTTGDIRDSWDSMTKIGFSQNDLASVRQRVTGTIPTCSRSATAA